MAEVLERPSGRGQERTEMFFSTVPFFSLLHPMYIEIQSPWRTIDIHVGDPQGEHLLMNMGILMSSFIDLID